ncbi:MAG: ABC transporter permease [candidate division WOR-3 bacterium]
MRKFTALLIKELRELINKQLIASFVIIILMFQIIGKIGESESKKLEERKEIGLVMLDEGKYSKTIETTLRSIFNVYYVEGSTPEEWMKNAYESDIRNVVVVPQAFSREIEAGKRAKIEVYAVTKSLGIRERIQKTILTSIINSLNASISRELLLEKTKGEDPEFLTKPVSTEEYVYLKGKILKASSDAIFAYMIQQSIFIPIILFLLLVFTSQMIATAMGQEKENKTLETLLTTPVSRASIIFAKMISAVILSCIFAGAYMYGFKGYMFAGTGGALSELIKIAKNYDLALPVQGIILFGICIFLSLLTGLLMTTIISLFVEDTRSAQLAITPVMILLLVPYFLSFTVDIMELSPVAKTVIYLIPFTHPFYFYKFYMLGYMKDVFFGIGYLVLLNILLTLLIIKLFSTDLLLTARINLRRGR